MPYPVESPKFPPILEVLKLVCIAMPVYIIGTILMYSGKFFGKRE